MLILPLDASTIMAGSQSALQCWHPVQMDSRVSPPLLVLPDI